MQQMEEGTKILDVDPDSKTPYSDATQVSSADFLDARER